MHLTRERQTTIFKLVLVSDNNGNSGRSSRRERQNRMEDDSTREEDRLTDDEEERVVDNTRHSTPHPSPGKHSQCMAQGGRNLSLGERYRY